MEFLEMMRIKTEAEKRLIAEEMERFIAQTEGTKDPPASRGSSLAIR